MSGYKESLMVDVKGRLALLTMVLVLVAPVAFSQTASFSQTFSPNFSQTHADFNSDGEEDFIVTYGCPNGNFGLVLSNGNGTYAPPVCYALPSGSPAYFAIGDFNRDGNPDVIVSYGGNSFYEYLGSASGKLHLQANFMTSTTVFGVAAADVNHDGRIDLLFDSFNASDTNLHVWFGNGDGGFTVGPSTPMAISGALFVGDFDGDAKADVFSELNEYGSSYQVFYGDGTGHFQAAASFGDDVLYTPYDLNGDGRMDLVGTPFDFSTNGDVYHNTVRVLYGNANRTFTSRDITLKNCAPWERDVAVADFNGDGINDLVVAEASDCKGNAPVTVNVLLGNADGTYQPEQVVYSGSNSLAFFSVLRGNRDTKPDFVVFEVNTGSAGLPGILFENTSSGNFPACSAPNHYTGITLCAPTSTVAAGSPVTFSIGASNQTAGRKVEVWIDGKKMSEELKHAFSYYSFLDASYNLAAGTHNVTVYSAGWDNILESLSFPLTVGSSTCAPPSSPGLNVCSPIGNSTDDSPVLAWASGTVTGTIARMEVWVDGVKDDSTYGSNTLKKSLSLAAGTHRFDYYIVNTAGTKWEKTVYAYVP
jgi:FG-GAP-like repeat/Bacterial Ig domain